jgi:hypothetical protein
MNNYFYLENFQENNIPQENIIQEETTSVLPSVDGNLMLWLDGNDPNGNGSQTSDETILNEWVDKSNNNRNAITNSPGKITKLKSGKFALKLDTNQNYFVKYPSFPNKGFTIFIILQSSVKKEFSRAIHAPAESDNAIFIGAVDEFSGSFTGTNDWNDVNGNFNQYTNLNTLRLFTNVVDGDNLYPYVDGNPQDNKIGSTKNFNDLLIGFYDDQSWIGDIGEILIYDKPLNMKDRMSIETYLGNKWDIKNTIITQEPQRIPLDVLLSGESYPVFSENYEINSEEIIEIKSEQNINLPVDSNGNPIRHRFTKEKKKKKRIQLEKFTNEIYNKIIDGFYK